MDRGRKHHNLREGNNWNMRKRKESIEVEWNNYLTSKLHIEINAWNKNTVGKYNRLKASPPFLFVHHTYLPPFQSNPLINRGSLGDGTMCWTSNTECKPTFIHKTSLQGTFKQCYSVLCVTQSYWFIQKSHRCSILLPKYGFISCTYGQHEQTSSF